MLENALKAFKAEIEAQKEELGKPNNEKFPFPTEKLFVFAGRGYDLSSPKKAEPILKSSPKADQLPEKPKSLKKFSDKTAELMDEFDEMDSNSPNPPPLATHHEVIDNFKMVKAFHNLQVNLSYLLLNPVEAFGYLEFGIPFYKTAKQYRQELHRQLDSALNIVLDNSHNIILNPSLQNNNNSRFLELAKSSQLVFSETVSTSEELGKMIEHLVDLSADKAPMRALFLALQFISELTIKLATVRHLTSELENKLHGIKTNEEKILQIKETRADILTTFFSSQKDIHEITPLILIEENKLKPLLEDPFNRLLPEEEKACLTTELIELESELERNIFNPLGKIKPGLYYFSSVTNFPSQYPVYLQQLINALLLLDEKEISLTPQKPVVLDEKILISTEQEVVEEKISTSEQTEVVDIILNAQTVPEPEKVIVEDIIHLDEKNNEASSDENVEFNNEPEVPKEKEKKEDSSSLKSTSTDSPDSSDTEPTMPQETIQAKENSEAFAPEPLITSEDSTSAVVDTIPEPQSLDLNNPTINPEVSDTEVSFEKEKVEKEEGKETASSLEVPAPLNVPEQTQQVQATQPLQIMQITVTTVPLIPQEEKPPVLRYDQNPAEIQVVQPNQDNDISSINFDDFNELFKPQPKVKPEGTKNEIEAEEVEEVNNDPDIILVPEEEYQQIEEAARPNNNLRSLGYFAILMLAAAAGFAVGFVIGGLIGAVVGFAIGATIGVAVGEALIDGKESSENVLKDNLSNSRSRDFSDDENAKNLGQQYGAVYYPKQKDSTVVGSPNNLQNNKNNTPQ